MPDFSARGEKTEKNKKYPREIVLATILSFLMSFGGSMLAYTMSSYFDQSAGSGSVGIFFLLSNAVYLVALLNFHKLVRTFGKSLSFFLTQALKITSLVLLTFFAPSLGGASILMVYIFASSLAWVELDIILETFSVDRMSGRIRGAYMTVSNAGFIFGPYLAMRLLEKYGYDGIFIPELVISSLVLIISILGFRSVNHRFEKKESIGDVLRRVKQYPNIQNIYCVSFVLNFFYALMTIYMPLYLLEIGFSWSQIGVIFTVMLVPFVIFQYPAGKIADKDIGEKELIIFSILLMAVSTMGVFMLGSASVAAWASVLFLTRVGASVIEILSDSYFYKQIDGRDVDLIDFFRTSRPVGQIAATALITAFLFFFSLEAVFFFLFLVVLSGLIPAFRLVDTRSEREMGVAKEVA